VRRIGLHHLRHAFASWLMEEGVGSFEVASALGHSTVRMMSRYAHLAPGAHDRVLEALERSRTRSARA
jgi:integrase